MKTVCDFKYCTGCGACIDICPKGAIDIKDELEFYNAIIDEKICIKCNLCHKVCPVNNPVKTSVPIKWHQGWARNQETRYSAASGGIASALMESFVKEGGVVCSCVFENGEFGFQFAYTYNQLSKFAGSKYVKSNPSGIYRKIKELLRSGNKVLFIGLPCQVAALKNYLTDKERLYTADLICHGTPSPKILECFLQQYQYSLHKVEDIRFRKKAYRKGNFKQKMYYDIEYTGIVDRYMIAFLNGLCYTENCYTCSYASKERVADVTLGDSWGSTLPENERRKGVSLILCQTDKGFELIDHADLILNPVDLDEAILHNRQLNAPMEKPLCRDDFFQEIYNGTNFNKAVKRCYPKKCLRQSVKKILIRLKLYNLVGGGIDIFQCGINLPRIEYSKFVLRKEESK